MHWQAACSKSLLVVFVAQLLLSAACVSTASASTLMQASAATAHCHNSSMVMKHASDSEHSMPACSHCDTPDMALSVHTPDVDMTPVLLAIILMPEMPVLHASERANLMQQRAPPHYFSLLHHTNQRILI